MSVHGSDISWHMLRRIVQDWIGTAAELTEVEPLAGGCINTTLALTTSTGDRAVLKVSPHRVDRTYVHEAEKMPILPPKVRKQIARIHERLDRLIAHGDCPRLIHSDLWSTNVMARPDEFGNWRICGLLDPMCKYAHSEAEIAYMELFKT